MTYNTRESAAEAANRSDTPYPYEGEYISDMRALNVANSAPEVSHTVSRISHHVSRQSHVTDGTVVSQVTTTRSVYSGGNGEIVTNEEVSIV